MGQKTDLQEYWRETDDGNGHLLQTYNCVWLIWPFDFAVLPGRSCILNQLHWNDRRPPQEKIYFHFTVHRFFTELFFFLFLLYNWQPNSRKVWPSHLHVLYFSECQRPVHLISKLLLLTVTKRIDTFFFPSGHRSCFQRAFISHCDQEQRDCRHRTLINFCHLSQTFSNLGQLSLLCRCCFILLWQRELF